MTLATTAAPTATNPAAEQATADQPAIPADQIPNPEFGVLADEATIERTVEALRGKGYAVHVVDDGAAAKELILGLLPEGAEVGQGASTTLDQIGVSDALEHSGRFDAVRATTR